MAINTFGWPMQDSEVRAARFMRLTLFSFLLLSLLASTAWAAKDIQKDNAQIKNGKLFKNLSLVDGSGFADEKLTSKSYRLYTDAQKSEPVLDFEVQNHINAKNILEDCQNTPYTCDFKINITPHGQNLKLSNNIISGGWQDGTASVQKVFFYQNETYNYKVPTFSTRIVNDTVNETYQNGTQTLQGIRAIEQEDLTQLYADDGQAKEVIIRFARTEIKQVDIFPQLFGKNYSDWSYWATGGTETTYIHANGTNMTVHTFTTNGTFTVNNSLCVTALIVAGGGSGGDTEGGGGGAGGLLYNSSYCLSNGAYSVVVGDGGSAGTGTGIGDNGANSSFGNMTAMGGGHGAGTGAGYPASIGGSGGGGALDAVTNRTGIAGQGNAGGAGYTGGAYGGGGGGGAGTKGSDGTNTVGGNGGQGLSFNITGTGNVSYACGGGGGVYGGGGVAGTGGCSNAGAGGKTGHGGNAVDNTGSGGGGGANNAGLIQAGNGSSGVVIISYPTASPPAVTNISVQLSPSPAYAGNTIEGKANASSSAATLANITWALKLNGTLYANATVSNVAINSSQSLFNYSGFSKGSTLNLTANATMNDGSTSNNTSTTLTISNSAPILTSLYIYNNNTLFSPNTILIGAVIGQDNDTAENITLRYSWLKNGANQTALNGSILIQNNTIKLFNTTAPAFTIGDLWGLVGYIDDGTNQTAPAYSLNATVAAFNFTTSFEPVEYDIISYFHILNTNLNTSISSTSAALSINSIAQTNTKTMNATTSIFTASVMPPSITTNQTQNASWSVNYTTITGETYNFTTPYSFQLNPSGFYLCNSSINTSSIYWSFLDIGNLSAVNATLNAQITFNRSDASQKINTLSQTNFTTQVCISPLWLNVSASILETDSATGYITSTFIISTNLSNTTTFFTRYLLNSATSNYYTFTVQNQYGAIITGATVNAYRLINSTPTPVQSATTDSAGSVVFPLQTLSIYTISVSAAGYQNLNYIFAAGATTTIILRLDSANPYPIVLPVYSYIWGDVNYSIQPQASILNTSVSINFTVSSLSSSLSYWGMRITKVVNGTSTIVSTQNSTVAAGGLLSYTANQNGTYLIDTWFKHQNFSEYDPLTRQLILRIQPKTGIWATQEYFSSNIITGWGYYFVAVIFALMAVGWTSQFTVDGAGLAGVAVLWGFTLLNPAGQIVCIAGFDGACITTTIATTLTTVMVLVALYLKNQFAS